VKEGVLAAGFGRHCAFLQFETERKKWKKRKNKKVEGIFET